MHQAAQAYARTAKTGETPRETEASVLINAAARLQHIRDDWQNRQGDLEHALAYNRRIWAILSTGAGAEENLLPREAKQGIANLAVFIFKRTIDTLVSPSPEKLGILVSINRDIAAGLRAVSSEPASQAA